MIDFSKASDEFLIDQTRSTDREIARAAFLEYGDRVEAGRYDLASAEELEANGLDSTGRVHGPITRSGLADAVAHAEVCGCGDVASHLVGMGV